MSNQMTSRALAKIGEHGGPRCCKRDSYLAILEAVTFTKEQLGIDMDTHKIVCSRSHLNNQCIQGNCPFHPRQLIVKRVQEMEEYFDKLQSALKTEPEVLRISLELKSIYQTLVKYLESGQWFKDYKTDEQGKLPSDLKRGVLSQDGLYNLLQEVEEWLGNENSSN